MVYRANQFDGAPCDAGEHKSEEILKLNPRGQVPTFVDGDVVVNESLAALLYIQDKYPSPSLLPVTIEGRALVSWQQHNTPLVNDTNLTRSQSVRQVYVEYFGPLHPNFSGEVRASILDVVVDCRCTSACRSPPTCRTRRPRLSSSR